MDVFKHMKLEHALLLATRGGVRVSAFSTFWAMENAPSGVADPFEGRTLGLLDGSIHPEGYEKQRQWLRDAGVPGANDGSAWYEGCKVVSRAKDVYVLSLTLDRTPGLFDGYDTVVGFSNIGDLGFRLQSAAPEHLSNGRFAEVSYKPVEYPFLSGGLQSASPFVKTQKFAWQREVRLIWDPVGPIAPYLDIECSELARLFDLTVPSR